MPDRLQLPSDAIGRVAPTERDPGNEGADDRRQLGLVRELRDRERERECDRDERAGRATLTRDPVEEAGDETHAHERGDGQERDGDEHDPQHAQRRHRARGREPHDHSEDDEPDHVIRDGGAEHGPRFDHRECLEVTQHPRRDAHAGRSERGADEDRLLSGHTDRTAERSASYERHDDADDRDRQRRASDRSELAQLELGADLEQQQDDPDLTEHPQHVARADEMEHRRPDQDAGEDLAHDRRDVQPLHELRRDLGGDQHDEDVEQRLVDAHRRLRNMGVAGAPRRRPPDQWCGIGTEVRTRRALPRARARARSPRRRAGTRMRGHPSHACPCPRARLQLWAGCRPS